ncbi:DUF692 family multinuclear iron-containing protein [Burkholderia ambifaria]|uniref:multinuclear nonheme iron-dependent oxidase n=1 Tax=Burkholderia ambifaria TaxID=152480 RepID=UPI00158BC384|nr:DUF692 family multinuclear iron-containing protein [Burkholderia ambifaria]
MTGKPPVRDFAIAATRDTLEPLCQRRLRGDPLLAAVQTVNLGLSMTDVLSPRLKALLKDTGWRLIVHMIDINLSGALELERLLALKKATRGLTVEWFEEDLGIWTWGKLSLGIHHLPPILDEDSVLTAAANIRNCVDVLERPLCVENPPIYFALGPMNMWDFMASVAKTADCGLVLDSGHMIGFDYCTEQPSHPRGIDWDGWWRVRELHVSGFQSIQLAGQPFWIDHHPEPIHDQQIEWIITTFPFLSPSAVICLEMDGAPDSAIAAAHAALKQEMVSA